MGLQPDETVRVRRSLYPTVGKPVFDRVAGFALFVAAVPLVAVIAAVVRVTLGPGVLFTQERVGLNGEPFTIYKFRTMKPCRRVNHPSVAFAGPDQRVCHKTERDPRHTRVGRLLRKSTDRSVR